MKKSIEVLTPKAIEYVENDNGKYVKYSNGVLECFLNVSTALSYVSSWGNLHMYKTTMQMIFPFQFIETPSVTVGNIYGTTVMVGQIYYDKRSINVIECIRPDKIDQLPNTTFSIQAIGRWK